MAEFNMDQRLDQTFVSRKKLRFAWINVISTGRMLGTELEEVRYQGKSCVGKRIPREYLRYSVYGREPELVGKYLHECQLMSSLRHPNIIQFFGVCYFGSPGPLPMLVMEQLEINLDDILKYTPDLPLSFKCSVLENVASGLLYLHERNPPVVHGDLRAKNVLLTSSSVAKITGFGSSRIQEPDQKVAHVPYKFLFDNDIQSFGHLVNFTITQIFHGDSLRPHVFSPYCRHTDTRKLETVVGHHHPLVKLVKECLLLYSYIPTADNLLATLQRIRKEVEQRGEKHFKLDMAKVKLTKEVCIKDRRIQELTQQQQVYEWKSARQLKAKTRELQIQEMKSAAKTRELKAELQLHELQSVQKTRELEAKTRELEDKTRQLKTKRKKRKKKKKDHENVQRDELKDHTRDNKPVSVAEVDNEADSEVEVDGEADTEVDVEKLLYEAMENGFVTSQDLILVLVGIAGSGKSSFKRVVLDLPLEELRVSTPLAEAGIRNISISRATISDLKGIKWEMVTSEELLEMLADAIKEVGVPQEPPEMPTMSAASPSADKTPPPSSRSIGSPSLSDGPTQTSVTADEMKPRDLKASYQEPSYSSKLQSGDVSFAAKQEHDDDLEFKDDPLLPLISKSKGSRRLLHVHWVYIIDTGGQPQFLQLLPAFIKNISACVCILRLDQNLDDHPLVQYFDTSGKQVGEPYPSEQTNLQVVESCVRTIHSKCSLDSDKSPGCFVVGTHLDQYEQGKCAESIEEKNERLLQKLSNTHVEASMMFYRSGDDDEKLIFPLNCRNPEERDHNVAAEFRKCVMNRCSEPEVKIPLAWFVLEERIRQYATKKGVPYVERAMCAKIASTLQMSKETFEAALNHLLKLNIFRCYSSAPDLIFCTTQVILLKLTELVQYSFQLRKAEMYGVAGEDIHFKNEGMISIEFLDRFPSFYSHLFTPECFLKILRELLAVADMQDGKHFMPSLLNELSDKELSKYRSSSPSLSALLILLQGGCLPNGLFTSLVASLKNNCGWQLAVGGNRRKPACLHQNCVTFKVPGKLPGSVTLIASFNYLEVHVTCPIEPKIDSICTRVYSDIKSGLETSWRVLYPGEVSFTPAFFCSSCPDSTTSSEPDCTPDTTHHADVSEEGDYEICSVNSNFGSALQESKIRWLKNAGYICGDAEAASYQQKQSSTENDGIIQAGHTSKQLLSVSSSQHYLPIAAIQYLDKEIDWDNDCDKDLIEIAKDLLKWEELLASPLKLTPSDTHDISKSQQSLELQRREVLRAWKSKFGLDATYKCLLEILAKANHTEGAKAVCRVLKRRAADESSDAS